MSVRYMRLDKGQRSEGRLLTNVDPALGGQDFVLVRLLAGCTPSSTGQ